MKPPADERDRQRRTSSARRSYSVTQRIHEIGVRSALGACAYDIVALVVRDGLRVVFAGIVVGVIVALWSGRFVSSLLFEASPSDPFVFGGVAVALVMAALTAGVMPALRAARVDPNVARDQTDGCPQDWCGQEWWRRVADGCRDDRGFEPQADRWRADCATRWR